MTTTKNVYRFARAAGSRIEHCVAPDATATVCGKDAKLMAKFYAWERGQDAKIRPLCETCREAYLPRGAGR